MTAPRGPAQTSHRANGCQRNLLRRNNPGLAGGARGVYLPPVAATLIKKYGNRRLYDTGDSRYITLEELAAKIRGGTDVRVVDATDGTDLTQVTLTQLILESGSAARMLPVNTPRRPTGRLCQFQQERS